MLRAPWPQRILVTVAIEGAFVISAFAFVPTYLHDRFGLSLGAAGAVLALYGLGGLVYAVAARRLVQAVGERGLARIGGALLGAGMGLLAVAPTWGWAVPGCFIGGVGFYMLHNTLQTTATQMAPTMRGTAVAMFASALFLGQSVGLSLAAVLVDGWSPQPLFVVSMAVLPLLGWWFSRTLAQQVLRSAVPARAAD